MSQILSAVKNIAARPGHASAADDDIEGVEALSSWKAQAGDVPQVNSSSCCRDPGPVESPGPMVTVKPVMSTSSSSHIQHQQQMLKQILGMLESRDASIEVLIDTKNTLLDAIKAASLGSVPIPHPSDRGSVFPATLLSQEKPSPDFQSDLLDSVTEKILAHISSESSVVLGAVTALAGLTDPEVHPGEGKQRSIGGVKDTLENSANMANVAAPVAASASSPAGSKGFLSCCSTVPQGSIVEPVKMGGGGVPVRSPVPGSDKILLEILGTVKSLKNQKISQPTSSNVIAPRPTLDFNGGVKGEDDAFHVSEARDMMREIQRILSVVSKNQEQPSQAPRDTVVQRQPLTFGRKGKEDVIRRESQSQGSISETESQVKIRDIHNILSSHLPVRVERLLPPMKYETMVEMLQAVVTK